jgi:hypothetical protein
MPKPAPPKPPVEVEEIRAKLAQRYAQAFGCEWPDAPWGERWSELLANAQAADEEYTEAVAALRSLQVGLRRVLEVAAKNGVERNQPLDVDAYYSRTTADYEVAYLVRVREDEVFKLASDVDVVLKELTAPVRLSDAGVELARLEEELAILAADPDDVAEYRALHRGMTRRLRIWCQRLRSDGDKKRAPRTAAGLAGPPPDAETGTTTWRRQHLVELLDQFPMRPDVVDRAWPVATNSDIAVVSLLAGTLDDRVADATKHGGAFREDFVSVLAGERKAVREARLRKAYASRAEEQERKRALQKP